MAGYAHAVRALVTGGAGFIGSHLCDALLDRGDEVLVIDDLSSGKRENLDDAIAAGARLETGDVTDGSRLLTTIEGFGPEAVFHLAAQIDVRKSMADPAFDARLNVIGTMNVLEAATRVGAGSLVFTSTGGAIYGDGVGREDELPFAETARCEPDSVYGQSKFAAEGYVGLWRRMRGIDATVVRLGNVYGPRQDPALEAGVVAIFCDLARGSGRPTVFGDGEQTRDYVHVADVVDALWRPRHRPSRGPSTSGPASRRASSTSPGPSGESPTGTTSRPSSPRPGRARSSGPRSAPRRRPQGLGWRASRELEPGLEQTLNAQ